MSFMPQAGRRNGIAYRYCAQRRNKRFWARKGISAGITGPYGARRCARLYMAHRPSSRLRQTYRFHKILEFIAVYGRSVLYFGAIVIYCVYREMQKLGYLRAVVDAKANQG